MPFPVLSLGMRANFFLGVLALVLAGCGGPHTIVHQNDAVLIPEKPKSPFPLAKLTHEFAVPVLMYHRVSELTPKEERSPLIRDLTVSPEDFELQIRFLKEQGFTFLLVREVEQALREGKPLPEKAVAITLDDGYRDNFTEAFPILKKHGARATVFMVTNNFGRPDRLAWNEAKQMFAADMDFQSHTVSHPDLTTLGAQNLQRELVDSKRILENGLKSPITSLAYPGGAFNPDVVIAVEQAGYLSAWKKGGGALQPKHASDPYLLPRVRIHGKTDLDKFKRRVLSGTYIIADRERKAERLVAKR